MIISLIVAVSENGVIGYQGQIPWKLPADLRMFKQTTMGHTLIMGRKTYESIGRPLPGRRMMVLSRQQDFLAEGCQVVDGLPEALELARLEGENEAFIAGGAQVYAQALPLAERIYWTEVNTAIVGDTFFPDFNRDEWDELERKEFPADEENEYGYAFCLLMRKRK